MNTGKIKIGQIGIGHNHASEKMNALRRLSSFYEVVGVVEKDPVWKEKRGSLPDYQGLKWMTEEELFAVPGLEAVAVETDGFDLVPTACRCAERNLHIHMDKPGGETLEPFLALLHEYKKRNRIIQLGYMYRNNPAVLFCFRAIRSGWLGDVFSIDAVMNRYDAEHGDYCRWLAKFQGGAMYIFGGHLIDLVISILGPPAHVTAFQRKTRDDALYDNGLAVMEYPHATATLRTAVCEVEGMKHRRLAVCGTRGTVEICPLEQPAAHYRLDPLYVRMTLKDAHGEFSAGTHNINVGVMNGRYDEQLMELARIIRGEITNPYPVEHEGRVQEALLAAAGYTGTGR